MIIASPWTRGGCVCSQVFDHTSVLQFLEKLLTHKTGKKVEETNISQWRRTVCGDLTSAFQTSNDDSGRVLSFPPRNAFLEEIHRAQFKDLPAGFRVLKADEIKQIRTNPEASSILPHQEPGVRRSCPLPYEIGAEGSLNDKRTHYKIRLEARRDRFGNRSAGAAFTVYALRDVGDMQVRNYAVAAGEALEDSWLLSDFAHGVYCLRVYGPNGFYREFCGSKEEPPIDIRFSDASSRPNGAGPALDVEVIVANRDPTQSYTIELSDNAYKTPVQSRKIAAKEQVKLTIKTRKSSGWYDVSVACTGWSGFRKSYAGRVEIGDWSISDPAMGRVDV
jgi:phospholipase C